MRREIFRSAQARALALLARAPVVHLATTTPEGAPVLRALDAAVLDDGVYFHGAHAGEKARCLGRPAVVSAEEVVAHVASWMVDPRMACPASTLYRSVQVHGTLARVDDPALKARALEALMRRWQPEGRHDPIDPADPRYDQELRATLVFAVPFERVDGKDKLLQNRTPEDVQRVLAGLWARGAPGDAEAIEAVRDANPGCAPPPFLALEGGRTLTVALGDGDAEAAAALLQDEYWWEALPPEGIAPAQRGSSAWVGARSGDGTLLGCARAASDGKTAWIYDVVVARAERGSGLGKRLVALLLDHPSVRGCRFVRLQTRDAQRLYARFGFVDDADRPRRPGSSSMTLDRGAARR